MGGNLDGLTASQKNVCENQVQMAREAATSTNAPDSWHFVVVCGEDGWKDYMAFAQHEGANLQAASADTNFAERTTFLRGSRMTSDTESRQVLAEAFRRPNDGIQIALK
jgi:nitroreductase